MRRGFCNLVLFIGLIVIVELTKSDSTTYFHVERLGSGISLSQDLFHALTRDQFVAMFPRVHVRSAISTEKLFQPSQSRHRHSSLTEQTHSPLERLK